MFNTILIGALHGVVSLFPVVSVVLGSISAIIVGLIAIFVLVPGPQPEQFLQSVVDFIAKISRK